METNESKVQNYNYQKGAKKAEEKEITKKPTPGPFDANSKVIPTPESLIYVHEGKKRHQERKMRVNKSPVLTLDEILQQVRLK